MENRLHSGSRLGLPQFHALDLGNRSELLSAASFRRATLMGVCFQPSHGSMAGDQNLFTATEFLPRRPINSVASRPVAGAASSGSCAIAMLMI